MAKTPRKTSASSTAKAENTGSPVKVDANSLVMALRQAEERVSELTDLVSRLNRALRQLEEQNQALAARIQSNPSPKP